MVPIHIVEFKGSKSQRKCLGDQPKVPQGGPKNRHVKLSGSPDVEAGVRHRAIM